MALRLSLLLTCFARCESIEVPEGQPMIERLPIISGSPQDMQVSGKKGSFNALMERDSMQKLPTLILSDSPKSHRLLCFHFR
jgi:hypothetical protein